MSLSRIKNKGEISTYQLLLEMATALKELIDNPKALEEAAKDAYALSDQEEEKAAGAKALIAQSDAAAAEAKKQQSIVDDKMNEYATIKASIDGTMDGIRKEQARLVKVDAAQGEKALLLENLKNDLERRESELAKGIEKLARDSKNLDDKRASVVADEAALKIKVAQLQGLVNA